MTPLAERLREAIGDQSVQDFAELAGLPHYVVRDVLSGKVRCPQGRYLTPLAVALEMTVDQLVALAYAAAPPRSNGRTAGGRRPRMASKLT